MTNKLKKVLIISLGLFFFAGCASESVTMYSKNKPLFIPEKFLTGNLKLYAFVENRKGFVATDLYADIKGFMDGNVIVLDETIIQGNKKIQKRLWRITPKDKGRYEGIAVGDKEVVSPAEIEVSGNAMFMIYELKVKNGTGNVIVTVTDRFFLHRDNMLIFNSTIEKFGFNVGRLVGVMKKEK